MDGKLESYIIHMCSIKEFATVKGIGQLAEKMVEMKKDIVHPLAYSLVTLTLIPPIAKTIVDRAFSTMNIVNNRLSIRMRDQWMNDCLVNYIKNEKNHLAISKYEKSSRTTK
jgi:hypothetical protein